MTAALLNASHPASYPVVPGALKEIAGNPGSKIKIATYMRNVQGLWRPCQGFYSDALQELP